MLACEKRGCRYERLSRVGGALARILVSTCVEKLVSATFWRGLASTEAALAFMISYGSSSSSALLSTKFPLVGLGDVDNRMAIIGCTTIGNVLWLVSFSRDQMRKGF